MILRKVSHLLKSVMTFSRCPSDVMCPKILLFQHMLVQMDNISYFVRYVTQVYCKNIFKALFDGCSFRSNNGGLKEYQMSFLRGVKVNIDFNILLNS